MFQNSYFNKLKKFGDTRHVQKLLRLKRAHWYYEKLPVKVDKRRLMMLLVILFMMVCLFNLISIKTNETTNNKVQPLSQPYGDKWIVITSINRPTSSIITLAKLEGWVVLVVGDLKTPKDWNFPNCIYLSVESQEKLGYNILTHINYNSYPRKNIGYLYAIEHGAKLIYDTDDDNSPRNFDYFALSDVSAQTYYDTNDTIINPYPHFGQSSMWPRGYPLNAIGNDISYIYKYCIMMTPAVQQGVVNGDPDVDAIYRMSRKMKNRELDIKFSKTSPPIVLRPNTYAPYNTQNTLIKYEAFWSLVLPVGVSFRTCDIWRGYWAQKLFYLSGLNLAFVGPTANQRRNSHDYLDDAIDEKDLYFKTSNLIDFLKTWECGIPKLNLENFDKNLLFKNCIKQLSDDLVIHEFWSKADSSLIEAWINDLTSLEYQFPPLKMDDTEPCISNFDHDYYRFYPRENAISLPTPYNYPVYQNRDNMQPLCWEKITAERRPKFMRHLLVIIMREMEPTNPLYSISNLQRFYKDAFSEIIFCRILSPNKSISLNYGKHFIGSFIDVHLDDSLSNNPHSLFVKCLKTVYTLNFNYKNLLIVTQHSYLSYWKLKAYVKKWDLFSKGNHENSQNLNLDCLKGMTHANLDANECTNIFDRQGFVNLHRWKLDNVIIKTDSNEDDCTNFSKKVICSETFEAFNTIDNVLLSQLETELLFCNLL